MSLTYLKNKYNTTYVGVEFICSIAYHNKTPVAFYGAIPQKFSNSDSTLLVAHACDSFTIKKYQGQCIHYQLVKLSYRSMKELNMCMHFIVKTLTTVLRS